MVYFDYGPIKSKNKVSQIKREHLIASKLKFNSLPQRCCVLSDILD